MDLSKMSSAPFKVSDSHGLCVASIPGGGMVADYDAPSTATLWRGKRADAEFHALARNAFDVMMRRGWGVEQIWNNDLRIHRWFIVTGLSVALREGFVDPFTALVEADRWYRENVEKGADE